MIIKLKLNILQLLNEFDKYQNLFVKDWYNGNQCYEDDSVGNIKLQLPVLKKRKPS